MQRCLIEYAAMALLAVVCSTAKSEPRSVPVQDTAELARAVETAKAGDVITLSNGIYLVTKKIIADAQGSASAPIIVRAAHRQGAHIQSTSSIAFEVSGRYWHFVDLDIVGVCSTDTSCEHAFHVIGPSLGFSLTGSRIVDFNAHVKVNASGARVLPAGGVIEDNEFLDSRPRHTDNPVAPINIDNALNWTVRANLIHDFQKDGAGEGSYGAFVKGGSQAPIMERNLVFCARDRSPFGHMVGLSFGAHGMAPALCPPHWDAARTCDPEVYNGVMRNNIIVNCNDDGIYLNRATGSAILFNTLVRTAGIEFRAAGSTGIARGNLMTGRIQSTQGAKVSESGNVTAIPTPQDLADWFYAPGHPGRLRSLPGPDGLVTDDYCGRSRGALLDVGALQMSSGTCVLWR